jgi:TRAP transporter 4TM/12TM fusion protein
LKQHAARFAEFQIYEVLDLREKTMRANKAGDNKPVGTDVEIDSTSSPSAGVDGAVSERRTLAGLWFKGAQWIALCFALFHLYTAIFGTLEGMQQRVVHVAFALALTFLLMPASKHWKKNRPSTLDIFWMLGVVAASGYLFVEDANLDARLGLASVGEMILGSVLVLALLEATRRLSGMALPIVASLSIIYAYFGQYMPDVIAHRGFDLHDITVTLFLTTEGVYSVPTATSSTFIILFIILGAIMKESGAAAFFTELATGLFGRVRGGPAKVAIVASSFFGMISGSAIANVSGTGVVTIPLMKRTGLDPRFAGAVEAVASTGGQFMPPIMAAAAFIIAEILGISYLEVAVGAIIPGILFYLALFIAVDLRASRLGLRGLKADQLPKVRKVLFEGGYLLLVPVALVYILVGPKYSPMKAAVFAIFINYFLFFVQQMIQKSKSRPQAGALLLMAALYLAVVAGTFMLFGQWAAIGLLAVGITVIYYLAEYIKELNAEILWTFILRLAKSLSTGAIGALEVATCCACAGIIIGMLMLTGLGLRLSGLLVDLAGNNLPLLLVLCMIAALIMGMGVPTIGAYIVLAVFVAPALIDMGIAPLSAHLFIFYFGVISCITPPVCLAAFAAAGISGAHPMYTGVTAFRLGIAGFIVPFVMVYNPEIIMEGVWYDILLVAATATIGVASVATALEGYWRGTLSWWQRGLFLAGGLTLISGGFVTDIVGLGLIGIVLLTRYFVGTPQPNAAPVGHSAEASE